MRRVSRELVIVGIIASVVVVGSFFQLFMYLKDTPVGYIYPLVHNYEADYYWYLSLMRQGWEGSLFVTSRMTSEAFQPMLINTLFPLLGWTARGIGVSLPMMYTAARAVFGWTLLFASYLLAGKLWKDPVKRAVSFALVIGGAPIWYRAGGVFHQVGEFWTGFDPMLRITWLPHHTAANTLLILSLILLSQSRIPMHTIGAAIAGAASAWLNPASGLTLVFVASVIGGKKVYDAGIVVAATLVPLVVLYRMAGSVFPWTAFSHWERFVFYPIDVKGYIGVLGVVGIVAIASIPFALKKSHPLWWGIVAWFLWPFLGVGVLSRWIPLSNGRYLQAAAYIPAAMLATLGIFTLIGHRFGKIAVVSGIILLSVPAFSASISRQLGYVRSNAFNPLVFVPVNSMKTLDWLARYARPGGVVLAPSSVSSLIPAMTGSRVVLGHPTFTMKKEEKERDVIAFYGSTNSHTPIGILKRYAVDYVWIEPGQKALEEFLLANSFIQVYRNAGVLLYEGIHE